MTALTARIMELKEQQVGCEAKISELKKEQNKRFINIIFAQILMIVVRNATANDLNKRIQQSKKRKETLLKFIQKEREKVISDSQYVISAL